MSGAFIKFYLEYSHTVDGKRAGHGNKEQADIILTKAKELMDDKGYPGVAIIYSANEGQTRALAKAYANDEYTAHISGMNQAQVMHAMESYLGTDDWSDLQMKMRIAPITTIANSSDDWADIVSNDLDNIEALLKKGWAVLGWSNQGCNDTSHQYAIGGGVNANLRSDIETNIQTTLVKFATDYPES